MTARAITLHQPWASLAAIGAKRIETRSWSTKYRGPLLVHAGLRWEPFDAGGWQAGMFTLSAPVLNKRGTSEMHVLPLGAVVASCQLVDVVPTDSLYWTQLPWKGWGWQGNQGAITRAIDPAYRDKSHVVVNIDQQPLGDFTPGRYAWLLEDIEPTTERCPRCWGSGHLVWDVETAEPCPTCTTGEPPWRGRRGDGVCPPIPMRGKQGLWTPDWS